MVPCRYKWNTICAGVSDHVATEMPSVQVYHTTWRLKYPICRCIRPRGNWNALCANVSDYVALEMLSEQVYQTKWQLKYHLSRCIRPRGNWHFLCAGYQNTWKHIQNTFTVSTMKYQINESVFLVIGTVIAQSVTRLAMGCAVCINITLGALGIFSFPLSSMSL